MDLNAKPSTLQTIHDAFIDGMLSANYICEVPRIMYQNLHDASIPESDLESFWAFMDGLKNCYMERSMTFEMTEFITDLNSVIMQIIRFMNDVYDANIAMNWYARRKSLVSDLKKIVTKAFSSSQASVCIRDRFGIRGILLNQDLTEEERISKIYEIFRILKATLTQDSPIKEEFLNWVRVNANTLTRVKVDAFLKEVTLAVSDVHDYILNPKSNGYQSLHLTLRTNPYSGALPGFILEIQLRTSLMDDRAEGRIIESPDQDQSHWKYKEQLDPRLDTIFAIDPSSSEKINIMGLCIATGKDSVGFDRPVLVTQRIYFPPL